MSDSSKLGMSFSGVLTLIFIVLKLTDGISWSWWWVFSPIWIDIGIAGLLLIIFIIYVACKDKKKGKRDGWRF